MLKTAFYIILAVCILYLLDVRIVVEVVDSYKAAHNYFIDYVLTFRYKQPITFICLPFIAIWLLGRK